MAQAPAENREIDYFNPVEVAGAGVKKSIEMLQMLLGRKQDLMTDLKPTQGREQEQFAVAKESVNKRHLLAQELKLA